MSPISAVFRGVAKAADATTAAAGALGGAAINGVVGGLQGAVNGVRTGLNNGSHSPAAAALTLGAIGAAGLVEWPVLITLGGAALVVRRLNDRAGDDTPAGPERDAGPVAAAERSVKAAAQPRKTAPSKATKASRTPATAPRKSTASRRTSAT